MVSGSQYSQRNDEFKSSTKQNIEKLESLFPNCITKIMDAEGRLHKSVNFQLLQQMFSDTEQTEKERYEFTWAGKKAAIAEAGRPSDQILRPCKEESVSWDRTENLYMEGDNLAVLKLLQERYKSRIKMIYIDPPYNTGSDSFVYADDFSTGSDDCLEDMDISARSHSGWCSMICQRLLLARNLLTENGVIFISIDDHEYDNLKKICDEIFGESNHCGTFIVNSTPNARDYGHIGKMHEYCLFYAKNISKARTNPLPDKDKKFRFSDKKGGFNIHPLYNSNEAFHNENRPNLYYPFYLYLDEPVSKEGFYRIGLEEKDNSVELYPPKSLKNGVQFVWRWSREKARQFLNDEVVGYQVRKGEYRIVQKMRHNKKIIRSLLTDTKYANRRGTAEVEELFGAKVFSFPKPLALLLDLCRTGTDPYDIVLDFFSGSATTAHALMQLNAQDGGSRRFIMVQRPEQTDKESEAFKAGYADICAIGKERIRRAAVKIQKEYPTAVFDSGFRVYKLEDRSIAKRS